MKENKRVLIFGVTGQDGSYLTELFLANNYEVVGVARRVSVDTTERLSEVINHPNFKLVGGDITDSFSVFNIIQEHMPSKIFNLAAQSHVKVSFEQPGLTWDVTAKGCLNILEAIKSIDKSIKFYQASTSEMFGQQYTVGNNGEKYQNETTKMVPCSPYAIAKLAAHNFVKLYRESYGIFACSGVLFNHESPRRGEMFVTRKVTKYVGKLKREIDLVQQQDKNIGIQQAIIEAVKRIGKLKLGNIEASRDWGHAKDYCRAMVMMLEQETPEDYVIGTGKTHTVRDLINAAFSFANILDWVDAVEIDEQFNRPSEVPYLKCDPSRATQYLKWKPEYSFRELIKEMVEYDIKNA